MAFSPAAAFTIVVGQNGFLTTALLVGGVGLLPRAPVRADVPLGVLTFKPQLWLMVPIVPAALIAALFRRTDRGTAGARPPA